MDNFEYLQQISQANRPTKRSVKSNGLPTSLIIKLVAGGLVLFFLLMAIGGMLGNIGNRSDDLVKQIYLRTTNLNSSITTYNRSLKSSQLRALGTALSSVLSNTSNQLSAYITAHDGTKNIAPPENISDEEANLLNQLNVTLENARLNGILDRHYHNQVGLQVTLLMSLTSQLLARTKDQELIQILTPFYSSLETFRNGFEAYSSD